MSRHVSVPSFGYTPPSVQVSKPSPLRSLTTPSNDPTIQPTSSHSALRPFQRAETAGKAAAKRMEELQSGANTTTKPSLYQNYGHLPSQASPPAEPDIDPSSPASSSRPTRPATNIADEKRARLHKLFNTWVPHAQEFYETCATLELTSDELKDIQDEIVRYRVKSAMAAGKGLPYRAEWETAPTLVPPQRRGDGADVSGEEEDPLGLGLPGAVAEGRRLKDVENLLD